MKRSHRLVGICACLFLYTSPAQDQGIRVDSEQWLGSVLRNLDDDNRRWNCARAMLYLYEQRESLTGRLRAALPSLDWQGQLAVTRILCETDSFEPDSDFLHLVRQYLCTENSLCIAAHYSTRYELAAYLQRYGGEHPQRVTALLKPLIHPGDLQSLWLVTQILGQIGTLRDSADLFTPELLRSVVSNLRDDHVPYNATFAVRICLLLGQEALPHLAAESEKGDEQSQRLSRLLIRAIEERDTDALDEINTSFCPLRSGLLKRDLRPLPEIVPFLKPRPAIRLRGTEASFF